LIGPPVTASFVICAKPARHFGKYPRFANAIEMFFAKCIFMSRNCLYIFGIASTPDSLHMSDSGPTWTQRDGEKRIQLYCTPCTVKLHNEF